MIISSEQLTAIGTVLMALLPVLGLIYSNSRKMGVLEFKVETMWQAQLRRGMAEAIAQNHGTLNSPFTADPAASALFGPLLSEMKNFINTRIKAPIRDSDILMLLEHEFGERVTQTVCIPNGMNQLGCMLVALSLIREGPVEIEAGQTFITETIITELLKKKKPGTSLVIATVPVVAAGEMVDAVNKLSDESHVIADKITTIGEEVHDIHEESVIKKRGCD